MQGVYISDVFESTQENPKSGVGKKIREQISILCSQGLPCANVCIRKRPITALDKLRARLVIFGDELDWSITDEMRNADYLYIRRPSVISRDMIAFLKRIRKTNKKCRILLELPTYPYDKELKESWHRLPLLWQDKLYRRELHKYIDKIVTLDQYDEIFGVPTLKIRNGIDLKAYRLKKQNETETVNIGCAAQFSFWHGIDRVLNGLAQYRENPDPKTPVHLYLAGGGSYLDTLVKETEMLGIQDMVTFCGTLDQEELYRLIYDHCDLGVESLRKFRHTKEGVFSTLKSREYLAVGLPFIYDGKVDVFEQEEADFCFQVSPDESPVDIAAVISFYKALIQRESKEQLSVRIRSYAERHIGWEQTFADVIRWLKLEVSETH